MNTADTQIQYWAHMLDDAFCEQHQNDIANIRTENRILKFDESRNIADCPYLYITELNKSINPPCRKIGISDGERISVKLERYSTTVPVNWKPYIVIFTENVDKIDEEDFIDFISNGNRIGRKELSERQSADEIKKLVAQYLDDAEKFIKIKSIWCGGKHYSVVGFKQIAKKKSHAQIGLGPHRKFIVSERHD